MIDDTPTHPRPTEDEEWYWSPRNGSLPGHWICGSGSVLRAVDDALQELRGRGVDGTRRRFRGRVLLELRCENAGHLLAVVQPTTQGSLLVPTVTRYGERSGPPVSARRRDVRNKVYVSRSRTPDGQPTSTISGAALAKAITRDPWNVQLDDDQGGYEEYLAGATLVDWPRDPALPVATWLYCRCGLNFSPHPTELARLAREAAADMRLRRITCQSADG
jgi:hypothetical protein